MRSSNVSCWICGERAERELDKVVMVVVWIHDLIEFIHAEPRLLCNPHVYMLYWKVLVAMTIDSLHKSLSLSCPCELEAHVQAHYGVWFQEELEVCWIKLWAANHLVDQPHNKLNIPLWRMSMFASVVKKRETDRCRPTLVKNFIILQKRFIVFVLEIKVSNKKVDLVWPAIYMQHIN